MTIDKKSVNVLGRWTWPHTWIADQRETKLPDDWDGVYVIKKK